METTGVMRLHILLPSMVPLPLDRVVKFILLLLRKSTIIPTRPGTRRLRTFTTTANGLGTTPGEMMPAITLIILGSTGTLRAGLAVATFGI